MFSHPDYDGHQRLVFAHDEATGLKAVVAVHSTALGPAFGGCRMYPYTNDADALTDVLRLSRGMTYKAAICELPYGGGKSVIIGDPRRDKTPELLRAMGDIVDSFGGRYITADDVGTTLDDLAVMRTATRYTAATTALAQESLAVTAYGVFMAITAAVERGLLRMSLAGLKVAVQGLGNVGLPLCGHLRSAGAELVVADPDTRRGTRAATEFGARVVDVDVIYDQPVDVFAPCALGAILNDTTIPRLHARIVCGGANNQLAEKRHGAALAKRGIIFVPDYLAGAGGVIDFYQEQIDDRPDAVLRSVERIRDMTSDVLARAAKANETPLEVADRIVQQRLHGSVRHDAT